MNNNQNTIIIEAKETHLGFADQVSYLLTEASKIKGTGIAKRTPDYIRKKIIEGKSVIALVDNNVAGFCYIESWGHEKFVANSGLIVSNSYRKMGLAKKIKAKAFELSIKKFPQAKIFGLTTSLAVMNINSSLGYKPVTFSELTDDETFWKGCETCEYFDVLQRTNRKHCLCTGMLYPSKSSPRIKNNRKKSLNTYARWLKFKQYIFINKTK